LPCSTVRRIESVIKNEPRFAWLWQNYAATGRTTVTRRIKF
jgi:hypothetical protein